MGHKIGWLNRPGTTGETWNVVTGCSKISAGCSRCYAERMSKRLAGRFGYPADEPFRVTLHPDRVDEPLKWRKPRTVFVSSMGDLFHERVPFDWQASVWDVMEQTPQHTYMILTKRADIMLDTIEQEVMVSHGILPNVFLGTTCENEQRLNERWPLLQKTPAAVRFLSLEPLLGPMDLCVGDPHLREPDWVIVGAETGPGARPMDTLWAMDVQDQCYRAGVPFFMKKMSNGAPIPDGLMVREWPGPR